MDQQDGSMDKSTCPQTWWLTFKYQDLHGRRKEPTTENCPLPSKSMSIYTHVWKHTQIHKYYLIFKEIDIPFITQQCARNKNVKIDWILSVNSPLVRQAQKVQRTPNLMVISQKWYNCAYKLTAVKRHTKEQPARNDGA